MKTCSICGKEYGGKVGRPGNRCQSCVNAFGRVSEMERFWKKIDRSRECWIWTGAKDPTGYGRFHVRVGDRYVDALAHRFAYERLIGPVPDGLTIDHLCRNRSCVNPKHMKLVSVQTNILRGDAPTAHNARKTHCVHGHSFDEANTYRPPGSKRRQCRTCKARRHRERLEKRREAWAKRTHCRRGHLLDDETTLLTDRGRRFCRICLHKATQQRMLTLKKRRGQ